MVVEFFFAFEIIVTDLANVQRYEIPYAQLELMLICILKIGHLGTPTWFEIKRDCRGRYW